MIREERAAEAEHAAEHRRTPCRASPRNRGTEPAKLTKLVRGELDWIVMKALEKDRTRRYETANGLARTCSATWPTSRCEACPPSARYRLGSSSGGTRGRCSRRAWCCWRWSAGWSGRPGAGRRPASERGRGGTQAEAEREDREGRRAGRGRLPRHETGPDATRNADGEVARPWSTTPRARDPDRPGVAWPGRRTTTAEWQHCSTSARPDSAAGNGTTSSGCEARARPPLRTRRPRRLSVAFSPDGKRIAHRRVTTGRRRSGTPGPASNCRPQGAHEQQSRAWRSAPTAQRIVTGSWDRTVRVWDAQTGRPMLDPQGAHGRVGSVAFSPDGNARSSPAVTDRTARVVGRRRRARLRLVLKGHTLGVCSVAFSPDGRRVVTGELRQDGEVWDAQTGQEQARPQGAHRAGSGAWRSAPTATRARHRQSGTTTAKVWDAQTGHETPDLKGHTTGSRAWRSAPTADAHRHRELRQDGEGLGRRRPGRRPLDPHAATRRMFVSVAFSPDGKRLVTGERGQDGEGLGRARRDQARSLDPHGAHGAVSPAWRSAPTASASSPASHGRRRRRVWDAGTRQETAALKGHTTGSASVAFSPDGKRVVTGS